MSVFDHSNNERQGLSNFNYEIDTLYREIGSFLIGLNKVDPEKLIETGERVKLFVDHVLRESERLTDKTIEIIEKYQGYILERGTVKSAAELEAIDRELKKARGALREAIDRVSGRGVSIALIKKVVGISKVIITLILVVTGHVEMLPKASLPSLNGIPLYFHSGTVYASPFP